MTLTFWVFSLAASYLWIWLCLWVVSFLVLPLKKFSTFFEWAFHHWANTIKVVRYLDDFLFPGKKGSSKCQDFMGIFHQLAAKLGVPLASEKTEGPTAKLSFLGIQIDSEREMPSEKNCCFSWAHSTGSC